MRWPILAALLLCACAHLDASDLDSSDLDSSDLDGSDRERQRQRRAWHACTRDEMASHGWLNCQ